MSRFRFPFVRLDGAATYTDPANHKTARTGMAMKVAVMIALSPMLTVVDASAQLCPGTTVTSGLRRPMGMALSNQGNVLVSETGTATPHSGRISIVDPSGDRRTLLDGLPSG